MRELSVLLCVYNAEHALSMAVKSILEQTCRDFEFIIVDDGSTDGSREILRAYAESDNRIRLIRQENTGLTAALNVGLQASTGRYIARQDADDISMPTRLETQLDFMKSNPDLLLTGTDYEVISDDNQSIAVVRNSRRKRIKRRIAKSNQFVHGSLMFRSTVSGVPVRYNTFYKLAQDYDLVLRMAEQGEVAIVSEVLYKWRFSRHGILANNVTIYGDRALYNHRRRIQGKTEDYSEPRPESSRPNPSLWAFEWALAERYLSGYKKQKARSCFENALAEQDMPVDARISCRRRKMVTYLPVWLLRCAREW